MFSLTFSFPYNVAPIEVNSSEFLLKNITFSLKPWFLSSAWIPGVLDEPPINIICSISVFFILLFSKVWFNFLKIFSHIFSHNLLYWSLVILNLKSFESFKSSINNFASFISDNCFFMFFGKKTFFWKKKRQKN